MSQLKVLRFGFGFVLTIPKTFSRTEKTEGSIEPEDRTTEISQNNHEIFFKNRRV
jgi:hypothetical protein